MRSLLKLINGPPGILVSLNTHAIPNINLLRVERVSKYRIIKLIENWPRTLIRKPHKFKAFVEEVKEMGFNPQKFRFLQATSALTSISKFTWARKSVGFERWGWTGDEILEAFGRFPLGVMALEKTMEAKIEFFVNKMCCKFSSIARHPGLLSLSLDKQIIPRNTVIQVLLSKGPLTKLNLHAMFACSEEVFMKRYIRPHEKEARELLKLYCAKLKLPR